MELDEAMVYFLEYQKNGRMPTDKQLAKQIKMENLSDRAKKR